MADKIELTLVHSDAKTKGVYVGFLTELINVWKGKSYEEQERLALAHIDKSKYREAYFWVGDEKRMHFFEKGYTLTDQMDDEIERIAGETGSNYVSFYDLYDFIEKRFSVFGYKRRDRDIWRTVFHNLNTKWLPTNEDRNYWTQYLSKDHEDPTYRYFEMPVLPSATSRIYKAGFDPDAQVD